MTSTVLNRPQPTGAEPEEPATTSRGPLYRGLSLAALLIGTAVLYLWNLSINGWANSFYTAAIQAGSQSWKAWFFGSSDMANSITVDKPPASLWIPALSVRVFGLNSWSVLVPEVLMGVGSVALLYFITRRFFGHWTAIGAAAVLALTPVAALMFRFDNPEALLILLMIAACGAILRAMEPGQSGARRTWWMVAAGAAVGFGFLTKQLEVMVIVPAMALTYLAFGPGRWVRRIVDLLASLVALIVSAGWWVLAVELWPASSRPYIGGSQNNSILELTFGYNGLGRLNGNEHGSVGGAGTHRATGAAAEMFGAGGPGGPGGPGGGRWGSTGIFRMFEAAQGGQIAWLIPSAVIVGVAALVLIGKAPRTDLRRAFLVLFGLWSAIMIGTFSFMAGIFHSYYTAAIAPALAAVIAAGSAVCWGQRDKLWVRLVLAGATWTAAAWGFVLLNRSPEFVPWVRYAVIIVGVVGGALLLFARTGLLAIVAASAAILAGLLGPIAYTLDTVTTAKEGSIISAGPQVAGEFGPGMGGKHLRGMPGMPPGAPGNAPAMPPRPGQNVPGQGPTAGFPVGGLLNGSTPSEEMVALLRTNADDYTWVAAAIGSNEASGYQIASGFSVMPIGGFNGTDPSPTLKAFQEDVAQGKIHYFISGRGERGGEGRGGFGMDESGTSAAITAWVKATFPTLTVDGSTLYDLTAPKK